MNVHLHFFPYIYLFVGKICGPKKDESSSETTQLTDEDTEPLMGDVAAHIPASVRT